MSLLRQAAVRSVRQPILARPALSLTPLRFYSSAPGDDKNAKQEPVKEDAPKEADAAAKESPEQQFQTQLAEKEKKIAELQDAYLRCLADQENLRERGRKEVTAAKEFAIQKFAKDLLDTVDILNMALNAVPENIRSKEGAEKEAATVNLAEQLSNLYTGVSMTETELVKTLKRHGIDQHNPEGETFDPNLHQALFQAPMPDKEAGTIFSVQKLGYTIKGRVLRPAQVGVVAESN